MSTNGHARALLEIDPADDGCRPRISAGKEPFLRAILDVIDAHRWPLSVRQVHYLLLAIAPLKHAANPKSTYVNDGASYENLVDLATRARVVGRIPWESLADSTRPTEENGGFTGKPGFLEYELQQILRGYRRDRMQGQPSHIEVLVEKNTVLGIMRPICAEYCVPLTSTRGMSSIAAKHDVAERFEASGKSSLVLLVCSDLDPAGDTIADDIMSTMRRYFGINEVKAIKVALTSAQVQEYNLPPSAKAKKKSSTYDAFVKNHETTNAWELEALTPEQLGTILRAAIESVIDELEYLRQAAAEHQDHQEIAHMRERAVNILRPEFGL